MLKIFVTGDNHIGLKYASYEHSQELVRSRIQAFNQMVETANKENCDLFVITGDLFENTSIANKDITAVLSALSEFNGRVIILPGNHDYYDEQETFWKNVRDKLSMTDNIMLLTKYRPYSLTENNKEIVLYPALCTAKHSEAGKNNLDWIKEENIVPDNTFRIGIAHGAVEGETIDQEGNYFLMTRRELENIPVDVWLIGHTHVPFPRNLTEEYTTCDKILNAGTHVQTNVACNTEGICFIVSIDDDKTVYARKYRSGNLRFYRKNITLTEGRMKEILDRELSVWDSQSVVDIRLSGAVTADEYENRTAVLEEVLSRFIESTYDDYKLSERISTEMIDKEFPETSFSAEFLKKLIDNPKEVQLAYDLLRKLKKESK